MGTVQKSPSLTVAESWLSTVVSTVMLVVPRTMCFQDTPSGWDWSSPLD